MKKLTQTLPISVLISLLSLSFSTNATGKEDIRWYQVEIILFKQNDNASLSEENWNLEEHVAFPQKVQELYPGRVSLKKLPSKPIPFSTVPKNETSLNGIYRKLSRSSQTEPEIHLAWIQPTKKASPLDNVHIYQGAGAIKSQNSTTYKPKRGFDGLVSLRRGHYLHLNIDMGFQEQVLNNSLKPTFNNDYYSAATITPSYLSYRMKQKRRIHSGEIHYFDHPRFGLIAQVTPIELPEPKAVAKKPVKPLELPVSVDNKSRQTSAQINPAKKN